MMIMRCVRDVFTSEWENCSAAQNNACCQHSGGSRHTSQVFLAARHVSSLWMDWNQSIIQETDLKTCLATKQTSAQPNFRNRFVFIGDRVYKRRRKKM